MTVTAATASRLQAVNDPDGLLVLLKIDHAALSAPVRLVNDTRNLVTLGDTYIAMPFEVTLAADKAGETPRARLTIDNTGRELTSELERLTPGAALQATLMYVHRSTPGVVEYSFTAALSAVQANVSQISATLGLDVMMRRPAVVVRFDPAHAPGVFAE